MSLSGAERHIGEERPASLLPFEPLRPRQAAHPIRSNDSNGTHTPTEPHHGAPCTPTEPREPREPRWEGDMHVTLQRDRAPCPRAWPRYRHPRPLATRPPCRFGPPRPPGSQSTGKSKQGSRSNPRTSQASKRSPGSRRLTRCKHASSSGRPIARHRGAAVSRAVVVRFGFRGFPTKAVPLEPPSPRAPASPLPPPPCPRQGEPGLGTQRCCLRRRGGELGESVIRRASLY